MNLVNLTPHVLVLQSPDGTRHSLPPSGIIARVDSTPGAKLNVYEEVPVPCHDSPIWGEVSGLPEPNKDTIYIVSLLVASRCRYRVDVFAPGTGPKDGAIRTQSGQIEAVTRLVRG